MDKKTRIEAEIKSFIEGNEGTLRRFREAAAKDVAAALVTYGEPAAAAAFSLRAVERVSSYASERDFLEEGFGAFRDALSKERERYIDELVGTFGGSGPWTANSTSSIRNAVNGAEANARREIIAFFGKLMGILDR